MRKVGKQSYIFENVFVKTTSTVSGKLEQTGPVGGFIDKCYNNNYCDAKTWEKAEIALLESAIELILEKGNISFDDVSLFISGDLNNQIAINNYLLKKYPFPHLGIYSACATLCQGIFIGSTIVDSTNTNNVLVATSSHNSTSERQFRNPTEYGGQKTHTTTFTATGAGACLLTKTPTNIKVTKATIGKVIDSTLLDPSDMGRAMAPAAFDTFLEHLKAFGETPNDYDLIVTGDLSTFGKETFINMLESHNIVMTNYEDTGLMLYDVTRQQVFSGGSGPACITLVGLGYLYKMMTKGAYNKILLIATGALLNPIMTFQKETIPSIAHAIVLERV